MEWERNRESYPHGGMQRTGNLVVLLESRAAAQDLGEPELADGTLHVCDLALSGLGSASPLRGLTTDTTDHVGMGQGLGGTLARLGTVHGGGHWLDDARMQRRGAVRDDEVVIVLTLRGVRMRAHGERGRHLAEALLRLHCRGWGMDAAAA